MRDLYRTLHQARRTKGFTQCQLAELLQLGQSYLSQVERGKHDIKTSTLIDLARVLDLEIMLVPRQAVPAVSYMISSDCLLLAEELPRAYGPLPDEV
ncbi:helix-turn-helix transcriptional regulator [bacterium]|nr:helix-turn-helix transcriptional regulator [bacterium]MBP9808154.1 helix-turn-helix transcriptional regulator [bacterium]